MAAADRASVSYVITVYNKRAFLPQVIAGLAAQQGDFAREFVFVDDGSSDGSGAEIARLTAGWADVRVITQSNHGLSHATNRGIEAARHDFIKLVDADDVLMPGATAMLVEALRQHRGAVLAYGRTGLYASQQEALARLAQAEPEPPPREELVTAPLPDLLKRNLGIGPSNSLYLASAVKAIGGCDPRVFNQDYSLALRLATAGAFVVLDRVVALCPAVAEGRINDGGPQCLHDANLALAYFLEEEDVPPALARAAVRRAAARAYHWARRRQGAGLLSYWTWLCVLAQLPLPRPPTGLVRRSCAAFTLTEPVRRGSA